MISTTIATVLLATAPTVRFTSDSVYKKDNMLDFTITETVRVKTNDYTGEKISEERFYTLNVKENYIFGYGVFNDKATEYVDGIKIDDAFLSNDWCVYDFNIDANHDIVVKSVYADDITGWLAMAKSGDFSALMSNPLVVLQFVYYILAAASLIVGGVGLVKAKKAKVKTSAEIASAVQAKADKLEEACDAKIDKLENAAVDVLDALTGSVLATIQKQNDTLIQATVLARNGDEESTLALLELLKKNGTEDVRIAADGVKARIHDAVAKSKAAKEAAIKEMKEAVAEISAPADEAPKGGYDGTSI